MKLLEKFEPGKDILCRKYYFFAGKTRVRAKTNLITQPISNFGSSMHIKLKWALPKSRFFVAHYKVVYS